MVLRGKWIEGSLAFEVHSSSVKHNERSGVEISNGKFSKKKISNTPSDYSLLKTPLTINSMVSLSSKIFINVSGLIGIDIMEL